MTEEHDYYIESIPLPETPSLGVAPKPWGKTQVVGGRMPKVDAYERLSGRAVYPSDVSLPGMLYGAILRSPHAHAVVNRIDVSFAEKMEGVRAVLSGSSSGTDWAMALRTQSTVQTFRSPLSL